MFLPVKSLETFWVADFAAVLRPDVDAVLACAIDPSLCAALYEGGIMSK
jgi:hypothetical protein